MTELLTPLTLPFLLAMFLAINMGGSGTAPAFSAAYGSRVIRLALIPGIFGIMVLLGAIIAGKEVSLTLGKGLLDQEFFTPKGTSIILAAVAASLLVANLLGVPQSTSQSTVLAIAGVAFGLNSLNTNKLFYEILPTWFILPIVSFILSWLISKYLLPTLQSKFPFLHHPNFKNSRILKFLLILSSLYVAFSIGANNVANAAAPIASLTANELGFTSTQNFIPIIILSVLIVAPCFAIGSSIFGNKVTEKNGEGIVTVDPLNATIIALIVSSLLVYASISKGIPTSLVQLNGAAFIAISISKKGWKETMQNKTVKRFFSVWAIAPIFSFLLSYFLIRIFN
ncbi:MAG: inorganic phosphate transporter [Chitinophagales bacterium]|nr:inorganic phosphate transporter [Chitinophagales bacterium]